MRSLRAGKGFFGIKQKLFSFTRENKKNTIILFIITMIAIFTGIFTAVNYINGAVLINFNEFSLASFLNGELRTLEIFFSRLFSYAVVIIVVYISSFSVWLMPFGFIVYGYRAYLMGLNLSIMIALYGLTGILTAVIIILPCQILSLIIIGLLVSLSSKKALATKKYGSCGFSYLDKVFLTFLALTIINAIETLLLVVFSSRAIFVI